MRQVLDEQKYMDFAGETSLKVVREYRRKYEAIGELLDKNSQIVDLVHENVKDLSVSPTGRRSKFSTETILRSLIIHQIEGTALRETVVRISESAFLRGFAGVGFGPVMDYSFLDRCLKVITLETW
jgi:hypothetical protein